MIFNTYQIMRAKETSWAGPIRKTNDLLQQFVFLHHTKPIANIPVFQFSHINFCQLISTSFLFTNNVIVTLLAHDKALNRAAECKK